MSLANNRRLMFFTCGGKCLRGGCNPNSFFLFIISAPLRVFLKAGEIPSSPIHRNPSGFSTLTALEAVYCYGSGYRAVKMTTEEEDEAGRLLRSFWERFGFKTISSDPAEGTEMRLELTNQAVKEIYDKYIGAF